MIYSEHFKSWLSGFIDGEGCFSLRKNTSKPGFFIVTFTLSLRADDYKIIEEIKKYFGCGDSRFFQPKKDWRMNQPPKLQVRYRIEGVTKCKKVIEHFDKYPLLAKKNKDYQIWKEAILLLSEKMHLKGKRDYLYMLCEEIKRAREYRGIECES